MSKSLNSTQLYRLVKANVSQRRKKEVFAILQKLGLLVKTPHGTYRIPEDLTITREDIPEITGEVLKCMV